ncbi:hypothetical protein MKX01_014282 [Papaver californicum]|nr:hypothetical protein MKX01_014282 [Papaver californicum]
METLFPLLLLSILILSCTVLAKQAFASSLEETSTIVSSYGQPKIKLKKIDYSNRRALAECAVGFGKDAVGGTHGATYIVIDSSDDPINPKSGTLRYGAVQDEPLWIMFNKDMVIILKTELMINSFKIIDGRGVNVEIAYGPCIVMHNVNNIIIVPRLRDGDGVDIFNSSHIWIDHCYLARCTDGLIDVIHGSTAITISNNYFTQHDKVMLIGHNDHFKGDKVMKVTLVFNRFGPGGYAHVANNRYDEWLMYAIGGSVNPTIFSEGNYFTASNNSGIKEVTKRESDSGWKQWKWRSYNDEFENGAFFVESGWGNCAPNYTKSQTFKVYRGSMVPTLTSYAGPLRCTAGYQC